MMTHALIEMAHVIKLLPGEGERERGGRGEREGGGGGRKRGREGDKLHNIIPTTSAVELHLNLLIDHTFFAPCLLSVTATATRGPLSIPTPLSDASRAWVSLTSPASMSTSVPVATEKGRGE